MTQELEDFINQLELEEAASDMHYSLYSIPYYYNEEPPKHDKET